MAQARDGHRGVRVNSGASVGTKHNIRALKGLETIKDTLVEYAFCFGSITYRKDESVGEGGIGGHIVPMGSFIRWSMTINKDNDSLSRKKSLRLKKNFGQRLPMSLGVITVGE